MEEIEVTYNDIVTLFPEFSDGETYSTSTVTLAIETAKAFISPYVTGTVRKNARKLMIELMCAHLLIIGEKQSSSGSEGLASGQVIQSKIGDIEVHIKAPENSSQLTYWLNQTQYGQQLLALMSVYKAPVYVGKTMQRTLNIW